MARESEISVAVLGKGGDFVLIRLDGEIDASATDAALARGFSYCGVMGVKNGQASVRCEPNPDAAVTMLHAALAFGTQVAERLRPQPEGDGVEWLERLYQLPDTREN
jgi:hypothetical protein